MYDIPSSNLISHTRFDVIIKFLFAKSILKGYKTSFYRDMYKEHLRVWNNFKEYNNTTKNTYEAFEQCFLNLIKDIGKSGFNKKISTIPVVDKKYILNGSHRLAAALGHNKDVWCHDGVNVIDGQLDCDYRFFKQLHLNEEYMDQTAIEYCKLKPNTYVVCLFPVVNNKLSEVYDILRSNGDVFYSKQITLNTTGAFNLMRELYLGEKWAGDWRNNYAGFREKADLCFSDYSPVNVVLINLDSADIAKKIKQKTRSLFNKGNHSVHINDTHEQSVRISKTIFNNNSIHYINNTNPVNYKTFNTCMNEFYKEITIRGLNVDDYCVVGSAPLAAYGLRECKDLDYLHFDQKLIKGTQDLIHSHNEYGVGRYHLDREDIIYNPENYFYHRGIKFASLNVIRKLKEQRNEPKDIIDVKLIDSVLL